MKTTHLLMETFTILEDGISNKSKTLKKQSKDLLRMAS